MLRLSQRDIRQGYKAIKDMAKKAVTNGCYEQAMTHIRTCVTIAQQFNWIYSDDELENLLLKISDSTIQKHHKRHVIKDRVVFYDEFCVSFVLAIQYLESLVYAGKEIIYVAFEQSNQKYSHIFNYVQTLPNTKLVLLKHENQLVDNQLLYDTIVGEFPEKLVLHILGTSSFIPALDAIPNSIERYLINLADQTFWLGTKAIDYILEFRQFGVSVSQQRRSIKPEQQLLIPFYPVIDNNPFQGFPNECTQDGKVLIFSGSDIYKVLDKKRMYWHLVKRILDTFPEVVFLFATKGDGYGIDVITNFITENHYEGRFIYTKFRPDINEVLAHTDIYMGTCPASGSLMSQLAARNATPILQYYYSGTPDDETEQAICVNEEFQISYQDEDLFMQEAEKLIRNKDYRKKQGERIQRAMIGIDQFNQLVTKTLETNQTQLALKPYSINYKLLDDRWFELESNGFLHTMSYVYGLLKANGYLSSSPMLFFKYNMNKLFRRLGIG